MTLTEDELARLAELEDLLTVGLVEQPINGSVLSWGEAALIAHRIGRHLLRAPVADTAGIDAAWREAEAALPKVWPTHRVGGGVDHWNATATVNPEWSAEGPTAAAALRALAAALHPSEEGAAPPETT